MRKHFLTFLVATLLPLASWAEADPTSPLKIKITDKGGEEVSSVVYNGVQTLTQLNIAVSYVDGDYTKDLKAEDGDYELTITKGETTYATTDKAGVGTYTIAVQGKQSYSRFAQEATITVTKKEVRETEDVKLGLKSASKVYGEDDQVALAGIIKSIPDAFLAAYAEGAKEAEEEDFRKCLTVVRSEGDNGNDAGEHTVTIKGQETGESNYSFTASKEGSYVTMEILQKELNVIINFDRSYNGNKVSLATLRDRYCTLETVVPGDEADVKIEKLTATGDNTGLTNADTYKLEATLTGDKADNYYIANEGIVEFTIKKVPVTITAKSDANLSTVYGEEIPEDLAGQFDFNTFVNAETAESLHITMVKEDGENVKQGGYPIYVYVDGDKVEEKDYNTALTNYNLSYEGAVYTITPKSIEDVLTSDVVANSISINTTYQGKEFDIEDADLEVAVEGLSSEDYTAVRSAGSAKNAGDIFAVTISGKGNYDSNTSVTKSFTITKASLTITLDAEKVQKDGVDTEDGKVFGRVYNGKGGVEDVTEWFEFDGLVGEDNIENQTVLRMKKLDYPSNGVNVGEYWVNVYKVLENGSDDRINPDNGVYTSDNPEEGLKNYTINYTRTDCKYVIQPKTVTYWIPELTKQYNAAAVATVVANTIDWTLATDGFVDGESFTTAPTLKPAKDGKAFSAKNVGTYDLLISNPTAVAASDNYTLVYKEGDSGEGKYTITPADLTITVLPRTVTYPNEIEKEILIVWNTTKAAEENNVRIAASYSLNADKTAIQEAIGTELTYAEGINPKKVGEQENAITLSTSLDDVKAALTNYNVNFYPGALTVNPADFILDGSEESLEDLLIAYNGQSVPEVTIKNLNNVRTPDGFDIRANVWYTLVLPFDVTVREISEAFGYAVVNIPDTSNGDITKVQFSLTVGEIPANTLMAFKTDWNMTWEDEFSAAFGGEKYGPKKIDYDTNNPKIVKDEAGNYFQGVYSVNELKGENEWYLWTDGYFKLASNYYNKYKEGVMIYPLNGYVYTANPNARIFMQEADGTVTAINAVTGEEINNAEGWYTINGIKLNAEPTEKGIYINNGKKVVIK